jgi:hypothetical protein
LQSIAFDTPPLILNREIGLFLPGYAAQWKAKSAMEWNQVVRQRERSFLKGHQSLVNGTGIPKDANMSFSKLSPDSWPTSINIH